MINNLEKILPLLHFISPDDFYFMQIIQRRKENRTIGADNIVIKDYYFPSKEKLISKMDEIIKICTLFNARAYIHLNVRSYEAVSFEALKTLADRISKKEFKSNRSIWATSCGRKHSDPCKKWIVDIDTKDDGFRNYIAGKISECDPIGFKILEELETKNGWHLITKPFNTQQFQSNIYTELVFCGGDEDFKKVDIQKNHPTILFVP